MVNKEKQNRYEIVLANIRGKIFSGELQAGTRLIEQDIAKEFGMSRGPIREALQKLEHEGLIVSEVNRGCTVARLSGEDAYEIFYLRGMLEKLALEKCGGRLLDSSIMAMRNIVDDMMQVEDPKEYLEYQIKLDERFHEEILLSSKMPRLFDLWQYLSPLNGAMFLKVTQYYDYMEDLRQKDPSQELPLRRRSVAESHKEILEILEKGNLQDSLDIMEQHYVQTGEKIYRWEQRIKQSESR